jgi:hypothetical protein
MRFISLCLILLTGYQVNAQVPKKIKNFSIEMDIVAGMTNTRYTYAIDNKGNGLYTHTVRDSVVNKTSFKLTKKQMTDLQESVINKSGAYDLADKINCDYCADGIDLTIRIFSNRGSKTITGNNPQRVNDDVNNIYKLIKSLVKEKRE